jgi:hypothetical protein
MRLTSFALFIFAITCGFASADDRKVIMKLPDPITSLPRLPSIRVNVYAPGGWDDMTFQDKPVIAEWRNRLFVAWTAAKRSENSRPTHGLAAGSSDKGISWSDAYEPAKKGNKAYIRYMKNKYNIPSAPDLMVCVKPVGFHEIAGSLYLFQKAWVQYEKENGNVQVHSRGRLFRASYGNRWEEIAPEKLDKMVDDDIRRHWMAHRFINLDNGKLLAATINKDKRAPVTDDPKGLKGWAHGEIPMKQRIVDPFAWQGPDGIVHFAAGRLSRLWHCYSSDGGKNWTALLRQSEFTDNNGGLIFGELPDGSIFYVGTPLEYSQRCPMIFARSTDGWNFEQLHQVRWEAFYRKYPWAYKGYRVGYENPDAIYCFDRLYVVYALCRDEIELSIVDIRDILE